MTHPHATDSLLPIIRRMHDAESDRERAAVLLEVPDRILDKYRPVFEQACARARFDLGIEFIAIRKAEWCATRGPDGEHKTSIFAEARKNFAAFARGATLRDSHPGLNPEFAARVRAERAGVAYVPPPRGKPAKQGRSTKDLFDAARQLLVETRRDRVAAAEALADIRRERQEIAEALAEARAQALTIITEAELAARSLVRHPALPSVAAIQKEVAARHGVSLQRLLGPGMAKPLVAARDEAIALAHAARPDLSFPALGRLFRRHHSSITVALKRWRRRNP